MNRRPSELPVCWWHNVKFSKGTWENRVQKRICPDQNAPSNERALFERVGEKNGGRTLQLDKLVDTSPMFESLCKTKSRGGFSLGLMSAFKTYFSHCSIRKQTLCVLSSKVDPIFFRVFPSSDSIVPPLLEPQPV